jgi:hypothetical protein
MPTRLFPTKRPRLIGPSCHRAVLVDLVLCVAAAMTQPGSSAAGGGQTSCGMADVGEGKAKAV